jgi:predicted enzyme related to lactoylglutathione lyase
MAGEVVHIEFPSKDMDRAQRFWGGLFGWSFADSGMPDMDYRMAQTGEGRSAALLDEKDGPGHANYYFACDDIEASSATVRELGGTASEKMPVPTHGWLAECMDSEGNNFRLWQADPAAG